MDTDENDPRHPYYARYDFPDPIPKTGNNHHVSGYVFVLAGCKLFHHQKIVFEMIQAYHRAEHEQDDNSNDSDFGFRPFFTTKSAGNIMLSITNIVIDNIKSITLQMLSITITMLPMLLICYRFYLML